MKHNSASVHSILFDMEEDLHRVDDYMQAAYLACGGERLSGLDSRSAEAVKRLLGDAHDLFLKLKEQWRQAIDAA